MAVIAGIDEAGFGPLLGPLVVSAAAFEAPDDLADVSLWQLLAGGVTKKITKRPSAVVIGDSKRLYTSQGGKSLGLLERGVLAMLAGGGVQARSLAELLDSVCPEARGQMADYPWYAGAELALPSRVGQTDLALAGKGVSSALCRADVRVFAMRSEVILAGQYNRLVGATRNKATTLLDVTCRLLSDLWRRAGNRLLKIHIDRQGGRIRYLRTLQQVFAGCQLKIVDENDQFSAYEIVSGTRRAELRFAVRSEDDQLPAALASMMSKYVRELFMSLLNRFWAGRVADLKPTAGYYLDGRRYLGQIGRAVAELGCDPAILRRSR